MVDRLGRIWGRGIVRVCGIDLDVQGLQHLQPGHSYVIISNHLSNFDIWCTLASMPFVVRFVAKKELLKIPVLGQALGVSGHIVIDRRDPQSAIARINAAAQHTEQGMGILSTPRYPQPRRGGPRVQEGRRQPRISTRLPVAPMSVSGTRKFLPRGCAVIRPGGRVRIVLDKPIPTTGLTWDDRDALNERVRSVVVSNFVEELA